MTGSSAATTITTTTLSMKLLVDTKARRVLFAEAGKEVVDFLFSLLALPIGTVVKLIGQKSMVGSVGDLYRRVEKLESTYVQPGASKDAILRPNMSRSSANNALLDLPAAPSNRFFACSSYAAYSVCRDYVTDVSGTKCPRRSCSMTTQIKYAPPAGAAAGIAQNAATDGFLRGVVTYTVMDSLAVSPMSAISSIALLNTFAVTDLTALQERTVQIGYKEGLEILKASLQSTTVLTDVFLGKKPPSHD